MKKLLFGAAAGLAALSVGAGIASAQTDEDDGTTTTVTEDPVVDDSTTDDSTGSTESTEPTEPAQTDGSRAGCDESAGGAAEAPSTADDSSS